MRLIDAWGQEVEVRDVLDREEYGEWLEQIRDAR